MIEIFRKFFETLTLTISSVTEFSFFQKNFYLFLKCFQSVCFIVVLHCCSRLCETAMKMKKSEICVTRKDKKPS